MWRFRVQGKVVEQCWRDVWEIFGEWDSIFRDTSCSGSIELTHRNSGFPRLRIWYGPRVLGDVGGVVERVWRG